MIDFVPNLVNEQIEEPNGSVLVYGFFFRVWGLKGQLN